MTEMDFKKHLGLLQVYTGNGKGKTTAALGLAFRASGHKLRVLMIQFMKDTGYYGEEIFATSFPTLTWKTCGRHDFVNLENPETIDKNLAAEGWNLAKKALTSTNYDLVILDEINVAMACGLVSVHEFLELLEVRTPHVELILTGRYAPKEILDKADLITEMTEVRHPFTEKKIESRKGVDY